MGRKILIIQGHPDTAQQHFCHALAVAYEKGACEAGHEVRTITVAQLDFPLLRSYDDYYHQQAPAVIQGCQEEMQRADHYVFIFPLWMGSMPAMLKAFIEQVFRPGFAIQIEEGGKKWHKLLKDKSAHIIITMGMPAFIYRWFFGAHSLKSLERNILRMTGINPIRESLIGMVESNPEHRKRWLAKIEAAGRRA